MAAAYPASEFHGYDPSGHAIERAREQVARAGLTNVELHEASGEKLPDDTFDFDDPNNIDCLVCHDQTGTYAKAKPAAGMPEGSVDLQAVARSIAMDRPTATRP